MKLKTLYFQEKPIRFFQDDTGIWIVADDMHHCIKSSTNLIDKTERDLGIDHISKKPVLGNLMLDCLSQDAILHLSQMMQKANGDVFRKWFKKTAIPTMSAPIPKPKFK